MSHTGKKPAEVLVRETHEPAASQNRPDGRVTVALTEAEEAECIEVTIHGLRHFLHPTTAPDPSNLLTGRIEEWNKIARAAGAPGV